MNRLNSIKTSAGSVMVSSLALATALGLLVPTYAQDMDAASQRQGGSELAQLEEIMVTARRREESLTDVPESIVAFGATELEQKGIDDLANLGALVPNLNLSQRSDGFPNVTIRGIGSFGNTQGVGFYLDDVQLFSDASSRFVDLARIEVLKGPQGTLYGGSNIGGAIKFVSARPEASEVFGYVKGATGSWNLIDVEGSLNVPLGESGWAARVSGFYADHDGFLTNANPPRLNGERGTNDPDIGAITESGARVMLSGPITDRLSLYAAGRWNRYDGVGSAWIREISDEDFQYSREVNNSRNSDHVRDTGAGMVELSLDLDTLTVASITSYTDTQSDTYTDLDVLQEFIFDIDRRHGTKVFTQELRFTSDLDGPFNWIGGVYYSKIKDRIRSRQFWFDAGPDQTGGPLGCAAGLPTCSGVWLGEAPTPTEEAETAVFPFEERDRDRSHLAAFGSVSYELDSWVIDFGLRVDRWRNATVNLLSEIESAKDSVEVLPRLSITRWLAENAMAYFTYSHGYEPGGYNLTNFTGESNLFGYDKERAKSYEVGFKSQLLDNRVSLSGAAFHINYTNRQIEYQDQRGDQVLEGIINLGDSKTWGVEAAVEAQATQYLNFGATIGWLDATWSDGSMVDVGTGLIDMSGTDVPYTNDLSWTISARYERPLDLMEDSHIVLGAQLAHNGEFLGLHAWDPVRNPSYTTLNLQAGIMTPRWELLVRAENVTNEDYFTDLTRFPNLHTLDGGETVVIGTMGQPRMVKASLTYRF